MLRFFGVLFVLFMHSSVYGCTCQPFNDVNNYNSSDYVGRVMVLFTSLDGSKEGEIIHYVLPLIEYKNKKIGVFEVRSNVNSSCGFSMDNHSEWLLFAYFNKGVLRTGQCSGNIRFKPLSRKFKNYEKYLIEHHENIDERLQILDIIKEEQLFKSSNDLFSSMVSFNKSKDIAISNGSYSDRQTILIEGRCSSTLKVYNLRMIKSSPIKELNIDALSTVKPNCEIRSSKRLSLDPNVEYYFYLQYSYYRENNIYSIFQINL